MALPFRLIRRPAVLSRTGWSRGTLHNRVKAGEFPAPVPTGPRTIAWVEAEVDAYMASCVAERDARLQRQGATATTFASDASSLISSAAGAIGGQRA